MTLNILIQAFLGLRMKWGRTDYLVMLLAIPESALWCHWKRILKGEVAKLPPSERTESILKTQENKSSDTSNTFDYLQEGFCWGRWKWREKYSQNMSKNIISINTEFFCGLLYTQRFEEQNESFFGHPTPQRISLIKEIALIKIYV